MERFIVLTLWRQRWPSALYSSSSTLLMLQLTLCRLLRPLIPPLNCFIQGRKLHFSSNRMPPLQDVPLSTLIRNKRGYFPRNHVPLWVIIAEFGNLRDLDGFTPSKKGHIQTPPAHLHIAPKHPPKEKKVQSDGCLRRTFRTKSTGHPYLSFIGSNRT